MKIKELLDNIHNCGHCEAFFDEDAWGYGCCEIGDTLTTCSDWCPNFRPGRIKECKKEETE